MYGFEDNTSVIKIFLEIVVPVRIPRAWRFVLNIQTEYSWRCNLIYTQYVKMKGQITDISIKGSLTIQQLLKLMQLFESHGPDS